MGLKRKTILKRLEHINLSSWHALKFMDEGLGYFEKEARESPYPDAKIEACLLLLGDHLWGVPSTEISVEELLAIAPAAGRKYVRSIKSYSDIWLVKILSLTVLCSLLQDDTELIRFAKWFRIDKLQPIGTKEQMAHQPILYYVADLFREKKFESFDELQKCMAFHRVKEPRLLMAALDAIHSLNAKKTFDNLIAAAIDHAKRTNITLTQRPIAQVDILAMYPSLLWNVAELRGLPPPPIPPEIRPFMLIRQTLGIPPLPSA